MKGRAVTREVSKSTFLRFFVLSLVLASPVGAEIHEGEGYVNFLEGGWDFSAFAFSFVLDDVDLGKRVVIARVRSASGVSVQEYLVCPGGIQFAPQGVEFDSLTTAPLTGYVQAVWGLQWQNYFVRTREGCYARIRMMQDIGTEWPFLYVYQDDGSTILDTSVAVSSTTWGRIKSLYQNDQ